MRCLSAFLVLVLVGCAHAEPGMTLSQFSNICRNQSWQDMEKLASTPGGEIYSCDVTGTVYKPQYHLFRDGVLVETLTKEHALAIADDSSCREYGADPESDTYVYCRMQLASIRSHEEMTNATLNQQRSLALLQMSATISQSQQNRLRANCIATTTGNYTQYSCK